MQRLNELASKGIPFLFITNFDASTLEVYTLDELPKYDIAYSLTHTITSHSNKLEKFPMDFDTYKQGFDRIIDKIKDGETYLLNFTCETPIQTSSSLKEIFSTANASFKLLYKDKFTCFSPERFIQIKNNKIYTYPMKGTIDASIPHADEIILADEKEKAEHVMVVDLLRNDLSMVSHDVKVNRFRYVEKINAGDKELLQISSEIEGTLKNDWKKHLYEIITTLLPAGSISGTPKKRTLEIINDVESYQRGFFSGIFGVFDGENLDSAVMIRFIEKRENNLFYKSGGGITLDSNAADEYQEMIDKIYIP